MGDEQDAAGSDGGRDSGRGGVGAPPVVCQSCRRPLDYIDAERRWQHTQLVLDAGIVDHDPIPVQAASHQDVVSACDFCSHPGVTWVYPCESFQIDELGRCSEGAWGACDRCHDLIGRGAWRQIAERAVRPDQIADLRIRKVVVATAEAVHAKFRRHRTGDPVPISQL